MREATTRNAMLNCFLMVHIIYLSINLNYFFTKHFLHIKKKLFLYIITLFTLLIDY